MASFIDLHAPLTPDGWALLKANTERFAGEYLFRSPLLLVVVPHPKKGKPDPY